MKAYCTTREYREGEEGMERRALSKCLHAKRIHSKFARTFSNLPGNIPVTQLWKLHNIKEVFSHFLDKNTISIACFTVTVSVHRMPPKFARQMGQDSNQSLPKAMSCQKDDKLKIFGTQIENWGFYWSEKLGLLSRKIGKLWIFIEKSALPESKIKQNIGVGITNLTTRIKSPWWNRKFSWQVGPAFPEGMGTFPSLSWWGVGIPFSAVATLACSQ